MRIPEKSLRNFKKSTEKALRQAKATGDPQAIERARESDEYADDLIRRNNKGELTAGDIIRMVFLSERLIELIAEIDWTDLL